MKIEEKIRKLGIIPVIVLDDPGHAVPLAEALIRGGLYAAEVTFRTAAAEAAIRKISEHFPEMTLLAGTVLTTEQADRAVGAGAQAIVSPGLNPVTVKHCQEIGVPVFPGILTPSEIECALSLGLHTVKYFPAEASGGLKMIKAMAAAYTNVQFMPTGGINAENVRTYLMDPHIIACGGSWMVKKDLINAGEFDRIEALAREASEIVREIRG